MYPKIYRKQNFNFTLHQINKSMAFKSIFFYDNGAAEGAGGAAEVVVENNEPIVEQPVVNEPAAEVVIPEDIQKELAELRAYKESILKETGKTKEDIEKEEQADKANFIKFGVDNDLFKVEDITKYESLKTKADAELVFPAFLEDFKDDNPELTDEAELAEAAKEEFEKRFKLNSENPKAKEKGLAKLAKEASEIRSPYESKVKAAESNYNEEKQIRSKMPDFEKFVSTSIEKSTPDNQTFKTKVGDEEVSVDVTITKEDRKEIEKAFKSAELFQDYSKDPATAEKRLQAQIDVWVAHKKREEVISKAYAKGLEEGVKKGSNVGAENTFALQEQARQATIIDMKQNQEANNARQRVANNR
jgi:hypothetical protein